MAKQIFLIKPHSFIDVITNSSSELFICDTNKDINSVREILAEMLDLYNRTCYKNYDFNECFGNIYKLENKNDVKKYLEEMIWWIFECSHPTHPNLNSSNTVEETKKAWDKYYKEEKKFTEERIEKEMKNNINKYLGKIIISSRTDNSIPYVIMDLIEGNFNAERFHLG